MISVNRYRRDDSGRFTSPSPRWFKKSCNAKIRAICSSATGELNIERSIYTDLEVNNALSNLFFDKCAYCECKFVRQDVNVEHYRPKGRVGEARDHPGYYWLAYNWDNLLPSCTLCNQKRREIKSVDGDRSYSTGGKGDSFPIVDESHRAYSSDDDLTLEEPLLLNPTIDDPSGHISFDPSGEAMHFTKRGEVSIITYHLNARRIKAARKHVIKQLLCLLNMREAGCNPSRMVPAKRRRYWQTAFSS